MASDPVIHELEIVRKRNQHPLCPKGVDGRAGWMVRLIEEHHHVYLPDYLYREYWVKRKTLQHIADDLGVRNQSTISVWLKMLDLNRDTILERAARHLQEDPDWS